MLEEINKSEFERTHYHMEKNEKWLQWAVELQSLAQAGLFYCKDKYELERYERIREISAEMTSHLSMCKNQY